MHTTASGRPRRSGLVASNSRSTTTTTITTAAAATASGARVYSGRATGHRRGADSHTRHTDAADATATCRSEWGEEVKAR